MSDVLKANIVRLLNTIGNADHCKGCGRPIWWVTTKHSRSMPVTDEGASHFSDCPSAAEFRRSEAERK